MRVQSMTNTDTSNTAATIEQILKLEKAGCEIVRVAVPDEVAAKAIKEIKKNISIPLIADIHFDHKLALLSLDSGADGLRLNPGNIGGKDRVREVARAANSRKAPIRIGVNSGSLEKDILQKYGHPTPEAMVESALRHIKLLEDEGFHDIKVSLKSSNVNSTIAAYEAFSKVSDYPLHLGITEAGTLFSGTIKSSVGIGVLLHMGIGSTLRVSLTADPVEEVRVAWEILKALEIRKRGINIISCPTCGRIRLNSEKIALEIEKRLSHVEEPVTVAVMGCVVNGPGEAKEADVAMAGGDGVALIYRSGEVVAKIKEDEIVERMVREVLSLVEERKAAKAV